MNRELRFRQRAEAWLFDAALALIPRLPRCVVNGLARLAGWVAWLVDRRDRRIATANVNLAYGTALSSSQKQRIVRQSFRTFARVGLDVFWMSRHTKTRYERCIAMEESLRKWIGVGPLLAVTAHYGNWEIIGPFAASQGSSLASVAKPVQNPLVDARITLLRQRTGQLIVPREGALKALLRRLRDGGSAAFALDQDTKVSAGGVFVEFFGVPAPVSSAAALLAVKMQVPIVPVFCRQEPRGRYRCYARPALMPADLEGLSAEDITQRIAAIIEEEIRHDPGQWLWMYKRWKRRKPGFDPSRYPFYADC